MESSFTLSLAMLIYYVTQTQTCAVFASFTTASIRLLLLDTKSLRIVLFSCSSNSFRVTSIPLCSARTSNTMLSKDTERGKTHITLDEEHKNIYTTHCMYVYNMRMCVCVCMLG